jgi:hypothetical protein
MKCIEPLDYKAIECYPFNKLQNGTIEREDGKCYFIGSFYNINPDIKTAKFHLTALHILYNLLRNKKQHCHSKERNDYYVRWNKVINERIQSIKEEVKDAN